jgi:hypothetical protein
VKKIALLLLAGTSLLSTNAAAQETNAPASKVSKVFERELPTCRVRTCVQCSLNMVPVPRRPHIGTPLGLHLCNRAGR